MKYLIFPLIMLLASCASTYQYSEVINTQSNTDKQIAINKNVPSDEAHIYIYRESGFVGSFTSWPVQLESRKIGALKNGSFILIKTQPGKIKLLPENHLGIFSDGVEGHEFNAYGGEEYYLKHGPDSIFTSKMKFRREAATAGKQKIEEYDLVKVFDDRGTQRAVAIPNNVMAISKLSGRAFIERGIKTYPARIGSVLFPGDKINIEEASQLSIYFNGGVMKITEKTSFQIPDRKYGSEISPPSELWEAIKKLLKGDKFEIQAPTPSFGVRG
jgi:hypothetical protein